VLGLTNPSVSVQALDDDEKAKSSLGYGRPANVIAESGLTKLVLRSDKPEAKPFQDWVTKVVLPAIRKHGAYSHPASQARSEITTTTSTPAQKGPREFSKGSNSPLMPQPGPRVFWEKICRPFYVYPEEPIPPAGGGGGSPRPVRPPATLDAFGAAEL